MYTKGEYSMTTDFLKTFKLQVVIPGEARTICFENLHRLMSSKDDILEFLQSYNTKIPISTNSSEMVLTFFDESTMWRFCVLCMVKSGLNNCIILIHLDNKKENAIIDAVLSMNLVSLNKEEILDLANQKSIRVFGSNTVTPMFLLDSPEQSKEFLRLLF